MINEKHAVILDIGTAYTKCGFAGETGPRCIIPSRITDPKTKKVVRLVDYNSADHLYCLLTEFIRHLYFTHLLVNPKDRRVIIAESIFSPTIFRETLAKVLFVHYEVLSVLFAPAHLMATHTLGIGSALVVDIGYEEATVIPIYEGVVMVSSVEEHTVGAKALHSRLRSLIIEHGSVKMGENIEAGAEAVLESLTEDVIEDIKVRTCFVTPLERSKQLRSSEDCQPPPLHPVAYPLNGSSILHIPGKVREMTAEVFFEQDGEERSLATLILDCIAKAPCDIRRCLAENIVVIGGSAIMPGLLHRLFAEVQDLVTSAPKYSNRLAVRKFIFHKCPAKENYVAWLGAAIFAATDGVNLRSLPREQYLKHGYLLDWSNLAFSHICDNMSSINL